MKTNVSDVQIIKEVVTGIVSEASDVEHIPISPSFELVLKVEEIPPLDVFYSPQHKAVIRK